VSTADLRKQFDKPIGFGNALLPYQENAECLAKKKKWEDECVALLEEAFGMDLVLRTIRFGLGWGPPSKEAPYPPNWETRRACYWGGVANMHAC
jgi:hypothetical protein